MRIIVRGVELPIDDGMSIDVIMGPGLTAEGWDYSENGEFDLDGDEFARHSIPVRVLDYAIDEVGPVIVSTADLDQRDRNLGR